MPGLPRPPLHNDAPPAALVLAGGASSRMGEPKCALDWHGSPLLRRVCGLVRRLGGPVVVPRQPGQALPTLPGWVEVVEDPTPGVGPLMGIAAGLAHVADQATSSIVTATDHPFLHPAVLSVLLAALDDTGSEVVVPVVDGHRQVMTSAWRTDLATRLTDDVTAGFRGPNQVLPRYRVTELEPAHLRSDPRVAPVDPDLRSLLGLNTPDDYRAALAHPLPQVTVERPDRSTVHVRAATVGSALAATGLPPDTHVAIAGGITTSASADATTVADADGLDPLLDGDRVKVR